MTLGTALAVAIEHAIEAGGEVQIPGEAVHAALAVLEDWRRLQASPPPQAAADLRRVLLSR